jgi:hypothetical protein
MDLNFAVGARGSGLGARRSANPEPMNPMNLMNLMNPMNLSTPSTP